IKFLRVIKNISTGNIVTQPYPGTKLDVLQIPISKKAYFYDVPGFSLDNSILYNLNREVYNQLNVSKPLKVRTIELKEKQCIYFGGLACIELLEGKETKFDCYFNEKLTLKDVSLHGKHADEYFLKLVTKGAIGPSLPIIRTIKDLDVFEINVTESNYRDIGVLGLGWVSFLANNQKIRIYVPKGVSIYNSRPKISKKGK
ncbi:MAG: hypothetical protein HUJ61_07680, partial [Bacilli bacterium]|nr:hypothetical protein [Bacilli bacterium]